jgi:hypothetical protein
MKVLVSVVIEGRGGMEWGYSKRVVLSGDLGLDEGAVRWRMEKCLDRLMDYLGGKGWKKGRRGR